MALALGVPGGGGLLLDAGAAQIVDAPIDLALAPDDAFLYALLGGAGQIAVFVACSPQAPARVIKKPSPGGNAPRYAS